ncbi:MAG: DUF4837 family protein [Calditrichota bacterium]
MPLGGLLIAALVFIGCSVKPFVQGDGGKLVVIADPLDRPIIQSTLMSTFGREVFTPQPEPLFNLTWTDGEGLAELTRSPVLLLAVTIDGEGSSADLLRKMVTGPVEEGIRSGAYEVFKRRDAWARGQLLLIVVGRTQRELGQRLESLADSLYKWAYQSEIDRLTHEQFARGEQRSIEKELHDKYGFNLRLQHDYILSEQSDSAGFIRFIRHLPERWIMAIWGELPDSEQFTPDFIYARRKSLGSMFQDPVMTYDDRWTWERGAIGGKRAILGRGLWATEGPTGGGPFFCYGWWNYQRNRYYIIDGSVFAPGQAKMPFLWQLETLAQSFTVND